MAVLMLRAFLQMKGSEMYSYSAVYLSGFSIFAGLAGLMMAQNLILHMIDPMRYMMLTVYETICSAGWIFMLYTSPLILAFAIWMAVSNVELLRHERPRFQNALLPWLLPPTPQGHVRAPTFPPPACRS